MPQTRQLAAIMFTDIQGYTALMQRDEELAIKIRNRHREIFNSTTEKFHGKILQYFGDGTLSTFKSAIDAVKCAMEMQMAFQKEPVIPVRIGIHQGDIVFTDDDIIGDGVNVASRIESLAVPGSVFISDKVYDEIKNQSSIETRSLKTFELKNVHKPIEVFAISNKGLIIPDPEDISGKTKDTGSVSVKTTKKEELKIGKKRLNWILYAIIGLLVLVAGYFIYQNLFGPDQKTYDLEKSIAVLPFTNMTNDQEQEYFSDGITEDIIAHLSKIADLRVVSRTSTRQYKNTTKTIPQIGKELGVSTILEGSVRKQGDQVRITAQLIDVVNDQHIWAESYDRDVTKIFDIQTEVASEILRVLKATLTSREEKNLGKPVTSEITAYDYYLKGNEALENGQTEKDFQYAAQFFRQAIAEDPEFASAYVGLAWTLVTSRMYGAGAKIWRDSALALNQKALSIDPELDEAHFLQSRFYSEDEDWEKAKKGYEKVLQLNPNDNHAMIELGTILVDENQMERGMELIMDGIMLELNQKDPHVYYFLGDVYVQIGEPENAKKFFNQVLKLKPDYTNAYYALLDLSFQEKNWQEALTYTQKLVEIERTGYSLDRLAWGYLMVGDYQAAEAIWRELSEVISDHDISVTVPYKHRLAYVLWKMGQKEEASKLFDEQISSNLDIIESGIETDVRGEAYDLAGIYAFLGNKEEALKWLQKSADLGFLPIGLIERDPLFDGIRQNAQFLKIIAERRRIEEADRPKFETIGKKMRELEETGILSL